jgi:hypothetical protein
LGDQLGHGVLSGDGVIKDRGVQRAALSAGHRIGFGDDLADHLEDPLDARSRPAEPASRSTPWGGKPFVSIAYPHAAFHRRSKVSASTASRSGCPYNACNTITEAITSPGIEGRPCTAINK